MKKIFKILLLLIVFAPCAFFVTGCKGQKTVVDISKSSASTEIISIYTVTYSDGTTSSFSVEDGEDGKDLNIEDIYEIAKSHNLVSSFGEFLEVYLDYSGADVTKNINEAMLSSVAVSAFFPTTTVSFGNYKKDYSLGSGSGVIYKLDKDAGDAYVITNYHVVYNGGAVASMIKCFLYGADMGIEIEKNSLGNEVTDSNGYPVISFLGNVIDATYVGGSMLNDIAVLKITNSDVLKNCDCRAAKIEDSNNVTVGSSAYAIGNAAGEGISVTQGIISVDSEYFTMTGADNVTEVTYRVMRIDAAVNGGNSGGGLFNEYGELIGIVNAKVVDNKVENIGYALPSTLVTRVSDNIIKNATDSNKQAKKVQLGITITSKNARNEYSEEYGKNRVVEDVVIYGIDENSLLSSTPLAVGDAIKAVTINGTKYKITRRHELIDLMWIVEQNAVIIFEVEGKENISVIASAKNFVNVK